jgi:V8-like Glu-specific endopeptidase
MRLLTLLLLLTTMHAHALTGGIYSTSSRYAAIVKIRTDFGAERNRQNCTGTFISPRHSLTAAHCLLNSEKNEPMSPIKLDMATFPKMDLFWTPITVSIPRAKFEIHPSYLMNPKASNPNDVGVIILDRAYSNSFLKLADTSAREGTSILMTGYGCDKKEGKWSTDFKYGAGVITDISKFLKLGRASVEFCEGDSGSPILIETPKGLHIVGVSSYVNLVKGVFGLSKDRAVAVTPNTSARTWIQQQLAK